MKYFYIIYVIDYIKITDSASEKNRFSISAE